MHANTSHNRGLNTSPRHSHVKAEQGKALAVRFNISDVRISQVQLNTDAGREDGMKCLDPIEREKKILPILCIPLSAVYC